MDVACFFAKSILCDDPSPLACNSCITCLRVDDRNYPDFYVYDGSKATIKKVMRLSSGIISGSLVEEGKMVRGAEVKVLRNGEEVGHGKIGGLKRFKDDVKEVEKGFECGILVEGFKAVAEGDIIECIKHENVTRRIKM